MCQLSHFEADTCVFEGAVLHVCVGALMPHVNFFCLHFQQNVMAALVAFVRIAVRNVDRR